MGEDQHVAVDRPDALQDAVGPRRDLVDRLATGPRPAPDRPVRILLAARRAVSAARARGLVRTSANEGPRRRSPSATAWVLPVSVSGMFVRPVCWPLRDHSVSP